MNKEKEKPKWDKPELVVLVRGRPEEVLLGCKGSTANAYQIHAECYNKSCNPCNQYNPTY